MFEVKIAKSEADIARAFEVRKKVFIEEQGVPPYLELDELDTTSTHFIINDGEKTVAAARLRESAPQVGKVERVCVLKEYRGKHLGALMMENIEKFAREIPLQYLKLNAQSYAVQFYEKLGFDVTSPEFTEAGIPHRAMEKNLTK